MATTNTTNNYPNPLDNYRSYSYQFILTLAGTTQAFIDQVGGGTNGTSQTTSVAPLLASVLKVNAPGQKFTINTSDIYLLVDTRRFSSYSITDLSLYHSYGTGNPINPPAVTTAVSMQLMDTTGISFFNTLMDILQNKLKTTRSSACFLLATIFVGHKDDGTTATVSTMYTTLMLNTIAFSFDASGSKYEMEFIEQEGGISRGENWTDQINNIGNAGVITTENRSNTLGGFIDAFEEKLNVSSLDFFQKFKNQADPTASRPGKLVQYMLTIPNEWRKFKIDSAQQNQYLEQLYKDNPKIFTPAIIAKATPFVPTPGVTVTPKNGYSTMTFSNASTIADAILAILESSSDFLKLASKDKFDNGQASVPKIVTVITTDADTYVVHYDVYPHFIPNKKDTTNQQQSQTQTPTTSTITAGMSNTVGATADLKNVLHYSYLFSGQNDSIIDYKVEFSPEAATLTLDTRPNIGVNRFKQNSAAGQISSNVDAASKGTSSTTSYDTGLRPNDGIFMPAKSRDEKKNNATQKTEAVDANSAVDLMRSKQEYSNSLALAHFYSTIHTTITVRGNPNIIAKYADRNERGGCPPHGTIISATQLNTITSAGPANAATTYSSSVAQGISSAKAYYYANYYYPRIQKASAPPQANDNVLNGVDVATYPMYVMVGIFAPNVDATGQYKPGEPMFTNAYFYNGPYRILNIETHFQDGSFSHTINMYSTTPTDDKNLS